MRTPTKIAFAGDWHADTHYAMRAIDWAHGQGVDTIVHVGDFGYRFVDGFSFDFLTNISLLMEQHDIHLYFVDGNHDNHEFLATLPDEDDGTRTVTERVHYLPRGLRWQWGGLRLLAMGGAYSVDKPNRVPGVSWWEGETITQAEALKAAWGGPTNILICHDCPSGVSIPGLENGVQFFGQEQIDIANKMRQMLDHVVETTEPNAVFCGHFHVRYTETMSYGDVHILNCNGNQYNENMYVITLDELEAKYS